MSKLVTPVLTTDAANLVFHPAEYLGDYHLVPFATELNISEVLGLKPWEELQSLHVKLVQCDGAKYPFSLPVFSSTQDVKDEARCTRVGVTFKYHMDSKISPTTLQVEAMWAYENHPELLGFELHGEVIPSGMKSFIDKLEEYRGLDPAKYISTADEAMSSFIDLTGIDLTAEDAMTDAVKMFAEYLCGDGSKDHFPTIIYALHAGYQTGINYLGALVNAYLLRVLQDLNNSYSQEDFNYLEEKWKVVIDTLINEVYDSFLPHGPEKVAKVFNYLADNLDIDEASNHFSNAVKKFLEVGDSKLEEDADGTAQYSENL